MPSQLECRIAAVAVALSRDTFSIAQAYAAEVANQLTMKDLAKLPDRTTPTLSAKKAGAADSSHSWDFLWFEAITELLAQRGSAGVPGLWLLATRDTFTYPAYAITRLLRLLVAREAVDANQLEQLFASQHYVRSVLTVRHIIAMEPNLLERLRTWNAVVLPDADGETLGQLIDHVCLRG